MLFIVCRLLDLPLFWGVANSACSVFGFDMVLVILYFSLTCFRMRALSAW